MSSSTSSNSAINGSAWSRFTSRDLEDSSCLSHSKTQIQPLLSEKTLKYSTDPSSLSEYLEHVLHQPDYSILRFASEMELGQCFRFSSSKLSIETHIANMKALLENIGAVLEGLQVEKRCGRTKWTYEYGVYTSYDSLPLFIRD